MGGADGRAMIMNHAALSSDSRTTHRRHSRRANGTVAVVLIFAAAGGVFLIYGVVLWREAVASENWPTVSGTVITSEVIPASGSGADGQGLYEPRVVYEYEFDGRTHQNDRISFAGTQSSNREQVEDLIFIYPATMEVTVFVNPDDPSHALLEPGPGPANWLMLAIGGLFTFGPLVVLGIVLLTSRP